MITVERTAPLLTVQDRGRFGYFASGVTRSGPLDALAYEVGNALVGNSGGESSLEGCQGGAQFRAHGALRLAITGGEVTATLNDAPIEPYVAHDAKDGDAITVERVTRGAVWYLALGGGIDVPVVLGSRSTLLAAGLGGAGGAPVKTGARLAVGTRTSGGARSTVPVALRAHVDDARVALCPAPRTDALTAAEWETFFATTFTVSRAVSRVGYRLEGANVPMRLPADLASEPACAGAMQLPPEGQPIVLMADHPTIGGYPIIGVVPACALGRLAQRTPGMFVRFERTSNDDAVAAWRREQDALSQWLAHD